MPADFEAQAGFTWTHIDRILDDVGRSISDLVSLRFYLAEAALDTANVAILK